MSAERGAARRREGFGGALSRKRVSGDGVTVQRFATVVKTPVEGSAAAERQSLDGAGCVEGRDSHHVAGLERLSEDAGGPMSTLACKAWCAAAAAPLDALATSDTHDGAEGDVDEARLDDNEPAEDAVAEPDGEDAVPWDVIRAGPPCDKPPSDSDSDPNSPVCVSLVA